MLKTIKHALRRLCTRNEVPILNYHGVISNNFKFELPYHIPQDIFSQHIEYLSSNYYCVSLEECVARVIEGSVLPRSALVITFDDGFSNNLHRALPILEKYSVPATIFVVSGYINRKELLWPEKLAITLSRANSTEIYFDNTTFRIGNKDELSQAYNAITKTFKRYSTSEIDQCINGLVPQGRLNILSDEEEIFLDDFRLLTSDELRLLSAHELITIGSHTVSHKRLSLLSSEESSLEIAKSKENLEKTCGKISYFAYPYGGNGTDFNDDHSKIVAKQGYKAAFSVDSIGMNLMSDILSIPRYNIVASHSINDLEYIVSGGNVLENRKNVFNLMMKGYQENS